MKFTFEVKNKDGSVEHGEREAANRLALAREFHSLGKDVVVIEEKNTGLGGIEINLPGFLRRVSLREKILFAKNLCGMLKAGVSMPRALSVFARQTKSKTFKVVLEDLVKTIDTGGTLSKGMEHHPKVFSTLYVSMVRAGEESGTVPDSLKEISVNLEKIYSLNKKVKGAMTYPAVIICAIILIGILMMIYVIPTLTGTFKELGVPLPFTTRLIIGVSDFLAAHTFVFFLLLIGVATLAIWAFKRPSVRPVVDRILLRLPVIGVMIKEINSARTARTLATLLSSRVPVTRALEITKDVVESREYKKVIDEAVKLVEKGAPLSQAFRAHEKLYPAMVGEMMEVGEDTGEISKMLADIAAFYETEVEEKTKNLSTIIEPILMIFIGAAVGFFAISMLTPMYSLLDSIQ